MCLLLPVSNLPTKGQQVTTREGQRGREREREGELSAVWHTFRSRANNGRANESETIIYRARTKVRDETRVSRLEPWALRTARQKQRTTDTRSNRKRRRRRRSSENATISSQKRKEQKKEKTASLSFCNRILFSVRAIPLRVWSATSARFPCSFLLLFMMVSVSHKKGKKNNNQKIPKNDTHPSPSPPAMPIVFALIRAVRVANCGV